MKHENITWPYKVSSNGQSMVKGKVVIKRLWMVNKIIGEIQG